MEKDNKNISIDYWNSIGKIKKQSVKIKEGIPETAEWEKIRDVFNITPEHFPYILDLGVGVGHFAIRFLQEGFKVTGVDISEELLDVCKKRTEHYNLEESLELILSDFKEEKFTEKFDAGYMTSTFHCLSNNLKEQEIILKNFITSIKKGGVIFIMEPNPYNLLYYLAFPFIYKKNWREGFNIVHSSPRRLKKLLETYGVSDIKRYPYGFLPTRFMRRLRFIKDLNEFLCRAPLIKKFCLFNLFIGIKNE